LASEVRTGSARRPVFNVLRSVHTFGADGLPA
jgi:hypothetical protein